MTSQGDNELSMGVQHSLIYGIWIPGVIHTPTLTREHMTDVSELMPFDLYKYICSVICAWKREGHYGFFFKISAT